MPGARGAEYSAPTVGGKRCRAKRQERIYRSSSILYYQYLSDRLRIRPVPVDHAAKDRPHFSMKDHDD
jgi:hypothetical protein